MHEGGERKKSSKLRIEKRETREREREIESSAIFKITKLWKH